jgi:hypothetical protein
MSLRKAFVAVPAGAMIAVAGLAPVATSAHGAQTHHVAKSAHKRTHHRSRRAWSAAASGGNVNCSGVQSTNVPYDLTVPSGKTCTITPGTKIGHDVNVNSGATLIDSAGIVGHDINGNSPNGMGIGGSGTAMGSVGNDINVNNTSGAGPGTAGNNYICNTKITHDVNVMSSTSKAGQWIIGDKDEQCSGGPNLVGHDLTVEYNNNRVDISDNMKGMPPYAGGITYNLYVLYNLVTTRSPVVENNFVGGNASCQSGTKTDGDSRLNVINGMNHNCPE